MGSLRRILFSVVMVYLAICLWVYLMQRRMQYFPATGHVPRPEGARYDGLDEVTLQASDGVALKCWDWPGTRDVTLVFFHGNAGHRGHRLDWIERFHQLGWSVFILDYRGYGGSEGSPTEEGLYRDGAAVAQHLAGRRLVYFGESLGCGVAIELARHHAPAGLVLQAPAISLAKVGQAAYPFLPVALLMKDPFDCSERIKEIGAPLLFVHGDRDSIVPMELGRALFDAANNPKEWYTVRGAGHNDIMWVGAQAYYERIHTFLEGLD